MEATKRETQRGGIKEEASPESFELPRDIIKEILFRLPAKSVGRFRCVSKLFCFLSSDPGFAKSQLDLTIRNDSVRPVHRKLIVSSQNLYAVDLDSIDDRCEGIRDLVDVELNYQTSESRRRNGVKIVGSSNGLVCISPDEGVVFLYNPTTRESKRLPEIISPKCFQSYGFGFDDLTHDYKVVKLVTDLDDRLYASVYSLKTDSWRRIRDLSYEHRDGFNPGVNLNGVIHWVLTLKQDINQRVILAFDIKTEEFREIPLPDEAKNCPHRFKNFIVGNLNGRLCVVISSCVVHDYIWVMNEYGVASSWSRLRISLLYRSMKPLCSTKNSDEVLLELDGDMVLYNFKTDASRNLGIRGVNLSGGFEYVESLVSPNSYGVDN